MRNPSSRTPESGPLRHWNYEQLKTFFIASAELNAPGVCIEKELPESLDIGALGGKSLECLNQSLADPQQRERAIVILFDPGGRRILMQKDIIVGNKKDVTIGLSEHMRISESDAMKYLHDVSEGERERIMSMIRNHDVSLMAMTQKDPELFQKIRMSCTRPIATIHSHTKERPFSYIDIFQILSQDLRAAIMSSSKYHNAIITTRDTVWIHKEDSEDTLKRWSVLLEERGRAILEQYQSISASDYLIRNADSIDYRIQDALIKTLSKRYHFGYYRGGHDGKLGRVV